MATGFITKRIVDAAQPMASQFLTWDSGDGAVKGFGLLVMPSGVKSYVFQYRIGGRAGRTRRYTIGRHGSPWTPESARKRAKALAEQVRLGVDPLEAQRADLATHKSASRQAEEDQRRARELAFDAYVEHFLTRGLKSGTRERTKEGYRGAFTNHVTPVLKGKALPEIKRQDIVRVLDRIPVDQPSVRRITFAVMRMLFNWAKGRGDIEASPLDGMDAPALVASRDRVLNDDELALVLRAAGELERPFGPMYELLLLTGQRRDEVAGLDWSELDRKEGLWTLPGTRAKNGETHIVPINRLARATLDRLAGQDGQDEPKWPRKGLLFTTTGETSISGFSRAKARLDAKMVELARDDAAKAGEDPKAVELAPWRLHDARRTLATGLQRLGVRFEVTEAVLNHTAGASRSGVAAVYQRHGWGPEKRAALDAWADHCDRLLNPTASKENVVSLDTAKKLA